MAQTAVITQAAFPGIPLFFRGARRGQAGAKQPVFKAMDLVLTGTYATGGIAISATALGLGSLLAVIILGGSGIVASYDHSTGKLLQYWVDTSVDGAALAQVVDTTDLGTLTYKILAIGTEAD